LIAAVSEGRAGTLTSVVGLGVVGVAAVRVGMGAAASTRGAPSDGFAGVEFTSAAAEGAVGVKMTRGSKRRAQVTTWGGGCHSPIAHAPPAPAIATSKVAMAMGVHRRGTLSNDLNLVASGSVVSSNRSGEFFQARASWISPSAKNRWVRDMTSPLPPRSPQDAGQPGERSDFA